MEFNKYLRAAAVVVFGTLGAVQVNAYSGGVTTYNKPTPTNVERVNKSTAAAGPERDATYQRTMRTAQTAAAASKLLRGLIRGVALVGTFSTLFEFAKDLSGIWVTKPDGQNALIVPDPTFCTVAPCYEYIVNTQPWFKTGPAAAAYWINQSNTEGAPYKDVYTLLSADNTKLTYSWYRDGSVIVASTEKSYTTRLVPPETGAKPTIQVSDAELEDYLAKSPRLVEILDEVDKRGSPVPFPDEVEDMPQPIVLSPTIKVNPDGSKEIEQTTLTPYRGPDGKTINWGRKLTSTQESPPDSAGNTIKKTTTTTSDAPASEVKKDDRPECEKSPDTLGCIKMDTPGGDIPKTTKDVSYVAESLFGSATCPQSRVINQTLTAHPIYLHFTPTCDALATFVKPMVIAIALFMAYLIILPGNRE